jgi:hypothetical protein
MTEKEPPLLHETKALNPWQPEQDKVRLAALGKLLEELGEASSATARCVIQGIDESEPVTGKRNRQWLEDEIADVMGAIGIVMKRFDLDADRMRARTLRKMNHLDAWRDLISGDMSHA